MKRAVLIMAYGAPNQLEDVEPFYTDIRGGRKPSPELLHELTERYKLIGGKSPLLEITNRQAKALSEKINLPVYVGMRHWTPWIPDALKQMNEDGIEEIVVLVMAPHYSKMSIGKYMTIVEETIHKNNYSFNVKKILNWHDHPKFIEGLQQKIKDSEQKFSSEEWKNKTVVFTAHSLPERILQWNDPYPEQLNETSKLIAKGLGIEKWKFAFQSAGRTPEPWLGPDILKMIDQLADAEEKSILICVVGFIADHLEVIYDIDIEAKPYAEKKGIHLERINMLNDDPMLMDCFADIVHASISNTTRKVNSNA